MKHDPRIRNTIYSIRSIDSIIENIEDAVTATIDSIELIHKAKNDAEVELWILDIRRNLNYIEYMIDKMHEEVYYYSPDMYDACDSFYSSIEFLRKKLKNNYPYNFAPCLNRFINGSYKKFMNNMQDLKSEMQSFLNDIQ